MSNMPTSIRLSEEIYEKIKEEANKEKRSLSKQIEYIIEKYYEIIEITKSTRE